MARSPRTPASRRAFVTSVGAALVAAGLPGAARYAGAQSSVKSRVLAPAASDLLFDRGLYYLQTGSLGPSPAPVIDATIAAALPGHRISTHLFNTAYDVDALLLALRKESI